MTSIAIVAHPTRREIAEELADLVDGQLVFDEEGRGCEHTHSTALSTLLLTTTTALQRAEGHCWLVILEDDALILKDFLDQLDQVLAVAPADIVGLYLGTGYPAQWQHILRTRVRLVDADPNFLLLPEMLNMVGYAVRVGLASSLAQSLYINAFSDMSADSIATAWCKERGLRVAYSLPSIVDHRQDVEPVITVRNDGQGRPATRRARRFGSREHWWNSAIAVQPPRLARIDDDGRKWYEVDEIIYE